MKRSWEWSTDEDDELLAKAMEEWEKKTGQIGGAAAATNAFQFELVPYTDRRCTKFGIHRRTFTARLRQHGGNLAQLVPNHVLPELIEKNLEQAIKNKILSDRTVKNEDWIIINMSSDRLQLSLIHI